MPEKHRYLMLEFEEVGPGVYEAPHPLDGKPIRVAYDDDDNDWNITHDSYSYGSAYTAELAMSLASAHVVAEAHTTAVTDTGPLGERAESLLAKWTDALQGKAVG